MYDKIFSEIFDIFSSELERRGIALPSVSEIAGEDNDPYRILTSTILSLRTKDKVTIERSKALFEKAPDIYSLYEMDTDELAETIKPSAFYRRKAENLKEIAGIIIKKYDGKIPNDMDALLSLPGVGLKTASLTLNLGFNELAICVDCHVHQILNRIGIINTKTAEETEKELRRILPKRFWIPLNEVLVSYGQSICRSVSPLCSECPYEDKCKKTGIEKHR